VAPYLTAAGIASRLALRFPNTFPTAPAIDAADADISSDDLDASGPFIGEKQVDGQAKQFPRSVNPDGTANADPAIPAAVLDWVALRAYQLSSDEGPAVKSESVLDASVTYSKPATSQTEKRMGRLLAPYLAASSFAGTITAGSGFTE
jgi:hypothetical protein